jgi:oxygen-dependent protoporphyrinogen oxidase
MTPPARPTVAVVGGGIAGLAAAWELVNGDGDDEESVRAIPEVHLYESADRIGGKLQSTEFAGRRVDLAADAFLGRRPEATDLVSELGLDDLLVPIGVSGASIWSRDRLRMMPEGLHLGVPTRWWPLLRSGILTPVQSIRVARDLVTPHLRSNLAIGDLSVGEIVEPRLGRPVVDRLVDPLVGGIHAGGVDELSAAATFPSLLAATHQPGSLMRCLGRSLRRSTSPTTGGARPPAFWTMSGSTASLAVLLAEELERRGVTVHTGVEVDAVTRLARRGGRRPGAPRWNLTFGPGEGGGANGSGGAHGSAGRAAHRVVLAVPAPRAAVLLAPHAPVAADTLATIRYASVAVVTLSFPEGAVRRPMRGTGFLVPRTTVVAGRPPLITGVTYLARKWPHLARPGDELIRASVGRFGDERHIVLDDAELTASVLGELRRFLDVDHAPLETMVTRWEESLPQYEVGHLIRVGRIEAAVAELDGVAVAGAALQGVGIPACIASGRAAGRRILSSLGPATGPVPASSPARGPDR